MKLITWDVIQYKNKNYTVIWTHSNWDIFVENEENWFLTIKNDEITYEDVISYYINETDFVDMSWRPLRNWDIFVDKDSKDLIEKKFSYNEENREIFTPETKEYESCTYNYTEFKSDCLIIDDEKNVEEEFNKKLNKESRWLIQQIKELLWLAKEKWIDISSMLK